MDLASDCIAKADILADLSDERRAPCAALRTAASGTTSERRTGDACGKRANTGVARDDRIVDTYPIAFPQARAAEMDLLSARFLDSRKKLIKVGFPEDEVE